MLFESACAAVLSTGSAICLYNLYRMPPDDLQHQVFIGLFFIGCSLSLAAVWSVKGPHALWASNYAVRSASTSPSLLVRSVGMEMQCKKSSELGGDVVGATAASPKWDGNIYLDNEVKIHQDDAADGAGGSLGDSGGGERLERRSSFVVSSCGVLTGCVIFFTVHNIMCVFVCRFRKCTARAHHSNPWGAKLPFGTLSPVDLQQD